MSSAPVELDRRLQAEEERLQMEPMKVDGVARVGCPQKLSEEAVLRFEINRFGGLPHKLSEYVKTPALKAHGHSWLLHVFPRGMGSEMGQPLPQGDNVFVSVFLRRVPERDEPNLPVEAKVQLIHPLQTYASHVYSVDTCWVGDPEFLHRPSLLVDRLENGALVVHVKLQVMVDHATPEPATRNYSATFTKQVYALDLYYDATFRVGGERFQAHKNVLAIRAPGLISFCVEDDDESDMEGMSVELFQDFLEYVYTNELPIDRYKHNASNAMQLLEVAHRFRCSSLKSEIGALLANHSLAASTACSLLALSRAQECPTLAEASMQVMQRHPRLVLASADWSRVVNQSRDLLSLLARFLLQQPCSVTGPFNRATAATDYNDTSKQVQELIALALQEHRVPRTLHCVVLGGCIAVGYYAVFSRGFRARLRYR